MTFIMDEDSLRRGAAHYGSLLVKFAGDVDAMLDVERVDSAALGECLGDLARMRGYTQEEHLEPMLEGFFLGLLAARRESDVSDDGLGPIDLNVTLN
jgi:hypothetical protein